MAVSTDDVLVIGAGPAGLLAAWVTRQRGAQVRVLATGIGTTHVSPGWIRVWDALNPKGLRDLAGLPVQHPYALAGWGALQGGLTALRQVCQAAGLRYVGVINLPPQPPSLPGRGENLTSLAPLSLSGRGEDLVPPTPPSLEELALSLRAEAPSLHSGQAIKAEGLSKGKGVGGSGFCLPTALGAVVQAAVVPESFAAGDLRQPGPLLIAGPAGWRDFYPKLCADNLTRQGYPASSATFDLPETYTGRFDPTPVALARLFDRPDVRGRAAAQLKLKLNGATRVGFPAVLGLERSAEAWRDLSDRLGVPVFEIPTLPPSVSGIRLFNAFKAALTQAGVPILFDMTAVRGVVEGNRAIGVFVPDIVRERICRANTIILATGGLYGGGIVTDHKGMMREVVFGLPLHAPAGPEEWFDPQFLGEREHPIHYAGVRANRQLQPVDADGHVILENVRIAGRLLAGYNPLVEGSTEGVWLATGYRAGSI